MNLPINPQNIHMKCVWNKNRVIPDIHHYEITATVETSAEAESFVAFIKEMLEGTLSNIAIQTQSNEKLISIHYKPKENELSGTNTSPDSSL